MEYRNDQVMSGKGKLQWLNGKSMKRFLHLLVLSLLIYLVVFVKLGNFHMRLWDESMFAVNTYEMLHNGKYFSAWFDQVPDLTNTKPLLTVWIQVVFVKIFGYNELALRLPSALAAAFTILALFVFLRRRFSLLWAWISALVLLTSYGFITVHTARTADSDALLTFFLMMANLSFFKWILGEKPRNILWFFLFLALAFSAKMYAALLFGPAWLIILILQKKFKAFVYNKYFVTGLLGFILICAGPVWLREMETPGYVREIFMKDAGRLFKVVEKHSEPVTFYLDNFLLTRYSWWFIPLLAGIAMSFFIKEEKERIILRSFALLILCYLLIITVSTTKLEWYDMPLYPCFALVAAYPICHFLQKYVVEKSGGKGYKVVLVVICLFIYPYVMMVRYSQENVLTGYAKMNEASERFLCKRIHDGKNLDRVKAWHCSYPGAMIFYKYKLAEQGQYLEIVADGVFQPGEQVLVSNDSLQKTMQSRYHFSRLDSFDNALLARIDSLK